MKFVSKKIIKGIIIFDIKCLMFFNSDDFFCLIVSRDVSC